MSAEEKAYYFTYGSNMLSDRFFVANQGIKKGIGTLKNYMLGFNKPVSDWDGAVTTIIKKKGGTVLGAIWEVDERHIKSLDE